MRTQGSPMEGEITLSPNVINKITPNNFRPHSIAYIKMTIPTQIFLFLFFGPTLILNVAVVTIYDHEHRL